MLPGLEYFINPACFRLLGLFGAFLTFVSLKSSLKFFGCFISLVLHSKGPLLYNQLFAFSFGELHPHFF